MRKHGNRLARRQVAFLSGAFEQAKPGGVV